MTPDECCSILEVSINISLEELKKKYKRLILKFHPDKNKAPNATQTFIQIKAAYEELVKHRLRPVVKPWVIFPQRGFYGAQDNTSGTGWPFTFTSS